ncbi:IclR family transcriptional regulator [Crateriforma spongiae]|uniref:IclR family transcriptional regulator n=1 Tax=Crateriforma spongiae TaxID=2724528 RepID=UPI001446F386|nr:IclR family transcriptional regulator [Crateriforma spongiae]
MQESAPPTAAKPEPAKYSVPAFEQGLDLLELLMDSPLPLSQKTIAGRMQRPVSSVFRLLNCLEQRGYVQRDPETSGYSPTMRLYRLAHTCPAHVRFRELAMAPMQALARRVGESCHLSIREGDRVRVIYNQPSPHMHSLNVSEDTTYSLIDTTAGKMLLAHLPASIRDGWLTGLSDFQALNKTQQTELKQQLLSLQRKKFMTVPSRLTPGVLGVDVLLEDAWLGENAVLAVPCIQKRSKTEIKTDLLPTIQDAASQITTLLKGM